MTFARSRAALLAGLLGASALLMASGCFPAHRHGDCDAYQVCDLYCDPFGCWEECFVEEYCDYDDHYAYRPDDTYTCSVDAECARGEECIDRACMRARNDIDPPDTPPDDPRPSDPSGEAAFCGACTVDGDCAEFGALCVEINPGERVCTRPCDAAQAPCPEGFACRDISPRDGVLDQCIPVPDPTRDNLRVCAAPEPADPPDDPNACALNADCPDESVCIDGECVEPEPPCASDADCADGLRCAADGECVEPPPCGGHPDCPDGDLCIDQVCVTPECLRSEDCGEPGLLCVNAACVPACTTDADCPDGVSCDPLGFCAVP